MRKYFNNIYIFKFFKVYDLFSYVYVWFFEVGKSVIYLLGIDIYVHRYK